MLKATMLASVIASLTMGANVAVNSKPAQLKERNAKIIVEVDRSNDSLTAEGIANTQQAVINNIKAYATSNIEVSSRFSQVANAFVISLNEEDIELVKKVPGVKSVTKNEIHWQTTYPMADSEGAVVSRSGNTGGEYGDEENISATTMNKPTDTYDGEGTVIAILDNEFFLRGATNSGKTPGWNHDVFTALDSSVAIKHKGLPTGAKTTIAYTSMTSGKSSVLGREGSYYYNNKVPFYFDYGGEITAYSQDPNHDFDVSSNMTYHGSHVASIAAANADDYKGIAPKAQLVCMKVFTNYKASPIDQKLGMSSSSGAYDVPIMEALEDCMTLKVDGINMSLGSNLNDFDKDSITNKTLHKLAQSGILTSISAGNSGKTSFSTTGAYANWTTEMTETGILSGYANDDAAMTIAAGQPTKLFYENGFKLDDVNVAFSDQIVNSELYDSEYTKEYKMEDLFFDGTGYTKSVDWQYIPGFGTVADYGTLDVSGKIAVVNRGSTSFADKYNVAVGKGAVALVVINNDPTSSDFNFRMSFGDDFRPSMPCALVLYKDKPLFEEKQSGSINLIKKEVVENPKALTVSSFSTDGATYDLDLKPDITAPGENIRGAVPPQKTEDRTEERRYSVYEYLSGTSMSAPNYAGTQALMLSQIAGPIYEKYKTSGSPTSKEKEAINTYRSTVDMRLMSTANPMLDAGENPELKDGTYSVTSPRKQGAGMVDIGDAMATKIYLEGLDLEGNGINKAKVALRNNSQINKGIIDISFLAHNEGTTAETFEVTLTVMRPAIASTQDIVTKDYNDRGEVDKIENWPGRKYWVKEGLGANERIVERVAPGVANTKDVYKVSRPIEYFATEADCRNGVVTTIPEGRYYNAGTNELPEWLDLPTYDYQSVYDTEIAKVNLSDVTIQPGTSKVTLDTYTLTADQKADIASHYDYGCFLEGYISLKAKNSSTVDLSMPYMGYYSVLNEEGGDYTSAPVVEPFAFEKNETTVYPSDLANDIAHSLLGKDKHDMGSMWVTGYLAPGENVNVDKVLANDDNFANITGFRNIGTNPENGQYFDNVRDSLFVGSENYSNTMIVQQFVLRSVANNYFTIKNTKTGEVVYKNVLEDMLFGEQDGKYPLFKSHVDENYLGAGYVAHRAYAIIPLYNPSTGEAFATGDYEIEFNYLLAGTNSWVNKTYNLKIDSSAPEVSSITTSGDKVNINVKESNLVSAVVGTSKAEFTRTGDDSFTITMDKEDLFNAINSNMNEYQGSGRLFIKLTDAAYGQMGIVVRFEITDYDDDFLPIYNLANYVMVQHHSLVYTNDFEDDGETVTLVNYDNDAYVETPVEINDFVLISRGPVNYGGATSGCAGNIVTTSATLSIIAALSFVALMIAKKRRNLLGGKN